MVCKTGKWRREGGSGWGWGCAVQEAGARPAGQGRTGSGREGYLQDRAGQDRIYLTVGMQLQSERTRPVASVGPPSPGSHQQLYPHP